MAEATYQLLLQLEVESTLVYGFSALGKITSPTLVIGSPQVLLGIGLRRGVTPRV